MMSYPMSDTAILAGKKLSYYSPITSLETLPLSYRRLVGAKAINVGSVTSWIPIGFECQCVAYVKWNKCECIF